MTDSRKDQRRIASGDRYTLFLVLFLLIVHFLCNISIRSISFAVDEYIPLGIAAKMAGLDWSHARSFNYYYGYVTLIFYIPLFKIPAIYNNPYLLTQAVLGINSVFHVIMSVLLYKALCMLRSGMENRRMNCVAALISVTILQVFNISLGAQIESMFCLCFMAVFYLMVRISVGKAHPYEAVLIALFGWAAYANNTRGVVLLIASALVLLMCAAADRKKIVSLLLFLGVAAALVLLHRYVILPEYKTLFASESNNTSSAASLSKVILIFTDFAYFKTFITALLGWLWSCIASTLGLFLIAGCATVFQLCRLIKRKDLLSATIPAFVLLVYAGSLALGLIYFIRTAYLLLETGTGYRSDLLIYVRYVACALPMLTGYGLVTWLDEKKLAGGKKTCIILFAGTVLLGASFLALIARPLEGFQYAINNTVFMAMFMQAFQSNYRYGTVDVTNCAFLVAFVLAFLAVVFAGLRIYGKKKIMYLMASVQLIFCMIFVSTVAFGRSEYYAGMFDDEIISYCKESDAKTVYIGKNATVGQYQLADKVVYSRYEDQDILILSTEQNFNIQLDQYELVLRTDEWLLYVKSEFISQDE